MRGHVLVLVTVPLMALSDCAAERDGGDRVGGEVLVRRDPPAAQLVADKPRGPSMPVLRLRQVRVMDTQGFGQPVEAFTFLAPVDWTVDAEVQWVPRINCTQDMIRARVVAASPDGLTGFEVFPAQHWQWSDDPMANQAASLAVSQGGCAVRPPIDATGFLHRSFLPATRPQADVVSVEPLPELAQAAEGQLRANLAMLLQAGMVRAASATAARATLRFDIAGHQVDEWITASVGMTSMSAMSPSAAMQGQLAQTTQRGFEASNLYATHAPAGAMERQAALFATIYASFRPNPRWVAAVNQTLLSINQSAIDGAAERSRIWSRYARETNEIITRGYEERQRVQDRLADQFSRYIRGVERYVDPSGRGVELSAGYAHAWTNGMGEYLMTDDPFFDPSRTSSQRWTKLEKAR